MGYNYSPQDKMRSSKNYQSHFLIDQSNKSFGGGVDKAKQNLST